MSQLKDGNQTEKINTDPETLFTDLELVGVGFCQVFRGIDKRTQKAVTIKIIDFAGTDDYDDSENIQQDIMVLSQRDCPNLIKYHGCYLKGTKLWIIMEYLGGGSALDLMKAGVFDENYIAIILREVLKGLNYLHSEGKLHRDIKAANILLSEKGDVVLGDSEMVQQKRNRADSTSMIGSAHWMAPEVSKQLPHSSKADIWSLGITAIELAKGEPPNSDLHPMRVLFLIPKNNPPQLTGNFTKEFKEFVELCLKKEPESRPSAKDLLDHPFLKNAKETALLVELIDRYRHWIDMEHKPNKDDSHKSKTGEQ